MASLSAGYMASRYAAPSSARACFIASATPPRSPSPISSRGLRAGGFQLLDTQFMTTHLASLGAIEISREAYHRALEEALCVVADYHVWKPGEFISGRRALTALDD